MATTEEQHQVPTRAALVAELEEAGVTGPAAELVLRATAPVRHKARVQAVLDACGSAAATLLVAILDLVGIGGWAGGTGEATDRHPMLSGLGKGRKQATDGDAWTAAIKEAARKALFGEYRWSADLGHTEETLYEGLFGRDDYCGDSVECHPRGDGLALVVRGETVLATELGSDLLPAQWARSLAARVMMARSGAGEIEGVKYVRFTGETGEWGALFNAAEAALSG